MNYFNAYFHVASQILFFEITIHPTDPNILLI
jgi:hypothetical protein